MMQKTKTFILTHKLIVIIIIIAILVGAYFLFKKTTNGETRYVTAIVEKGNVTMTVTGTGQVEALDTIDLKSNTTGNITYVGVKVGETVGKGKLIASVDSRDAKLALENAKITLAKLVGAPDSLSLLQKQNSLAKSYNDGWNTLSSYITDITLMVIDLENIYNDGYLGNQNTIGLSKTGKAKVALGESNYYEIKDNIKEITKLYKTLSRSSGDVEIRNLIDKAYDSSVMMANTIKNTEAAFNYVVDDLNYQNDSDTATTRTDITSWLDSSNSYVSSLLSTNNSINENTQSLEDFLAGADELDIKSAELSVENKQQAYNDCFIYAPFAGVIATLTAQVGESSGSSIGTLITKQKIATISLNEVDIAKIRLDQKVTLTFDAIEDLTITGEVIEIDSVGTVSQGVVSYNVKISFDIEDDRIKPGMSVSAAIITSMTQDVLVLPNSAIKSQNGINYVLVFDSPLQNAAAGGQGSVSTVFPKQIEIGIGLSDDTSTEIVSGLKEGDIIVIKTIIGTTTSTTKTTTPSILGAVGGGMGGGPRN